MLLVALVLVIQTDAEVAAALKTAPAPVRAFVERRMRCNHWAGEQPYDRDRAREIAAALRVDRCAALDRDAVTLRRRFASNPAALDLLRRSADWPE